jgi:hypothetical protein
VFLPRLSQHAYCILCLTAAVVLTELVGYINKVILLILMRTCVKQHPNYLLVASHEAACSALP